MGGYGSGRWGTSKTDAKPLVEDSHVLCVNHLVRRGIVRAGSRKAGVLTWSRGGVPTACVSYEAEVGAEAGKLRLRYTVHRAGGRRDDHDYSLALVSSVLCSGGRRWWFRCTACRAGGASCGRRAEKLYLPPGGVVFACRRCHDLAYTSSRESRKHTALYRGLAASMGLPAGRVRAALLRGCRR